MEIDHLKKLAEGNPKADLRLLEHAAQQRALLQNPKRSYRLDDRSVATARSQQSLRCDND